MTSLPEVGAPRGPRSGLRLTAETAVGVAGVAIAIATWEVSIRLGLLDASAIPPFSDVARALVDELDSSRFWTPLGETCKSTAIGLLLSLLLALPIGVALGLSRRAFRSVRFVVEFLKPIPVVAILPLALLIYGTSLNMKLLLIVFGTFWPLLIQVLYGVQAVDPVVDLTARAYRISGRRRLTSVILPSAAPFIATGLRVAVVTALVLSIVTELVGGAAGLGFEISRAELSANFPRLYALVLVTGLLGLGLNAAVQWPERRVLRWHPSHRPGVTS